MWTFGVQTQNLFGWQSNTLSTKLMTKSSLGHNVKALTHKTDVKERVTTADCVWTKKWQVVCCFAHTLLFSCTNSLKLNSQSESFLSPRAINTLINRPEKGAVTTISANGAGHTPQIPWRQTLTEGPTYWPRARPSARCV